MLYNYDFEQAPVWDRLSAAQQAAVREFAASRYREGDDLRVIHDAETLHRANNWLMWCLRSHDYRDDVLGEAQTQIVIPLFQMQVQLLIHESGARQLQLWGNGDRDG